MNADLKGNAMNQSTEERIAAAHARWKESGPIVAALAEAVCDVLDHHMAHVESCEELTDLILERIAPFTKVAEIGLHTIAMKAEGKQNV